MNSTGRKRRSPLPQWQVDRIVHLFTKEGLTMDAIGWLYGRRSEKDIRQILWKAGVRLNREGQGPGNRVPDATVAAMHADYTANMSMAALSRKYGRSRRAIGQLFARRGLAVRPYFGPLVKRPNGTFKALVPFTDAEIEAMINEATDVAIPDALRAEWRKWPLERRADFVARLRARLGPPLPDPSLFSANVEFFSYGSPRAHALMDKINAGTESRTARVKINLKTWGVIYGDLLWTWSPHLGFVQGPFVPGVGRAALHQVLFRKHIGPIPAGHVIRFSDGNRFNLDPSNFVLATRNDVARENQAKALMRKSRERVGILLKRQTTDTDDLVRRIAS
jgi:hypothetical protein